ncbi:unnamed protein product [Somion occarium]|uniref:S-adenosylmethionine-dependent methyltransferase n=1 Tax=Somion occarium TaxID=3059160 RepID=A0ABP1CJD3_9APHY
MAYSANRYTKPVPPTSNLPPLARLSSSSLSQIKNALHNLRTLYFSSHISTTPPIPLRALPKHLIHDTTVPDSGYASAEEDEDDGMTDFEPSRSSEGNDDDEDIAILRADTFEREFAVRWLTGFTARSDTWVYSPDVIDEMEESARAEVVDEAASLLALFAGGDEEEALTRTFIFPLRTGKHVEVELNDAPLLSEDHTSVGLQSWASSILLAERLCADSAAFDLSVDGKCGGRILELGAGTGLLSIAITKLQRICHEPANDANSIIVATDYHPSVLANLKANVSHNFPSSPVPPIQVLPLDWQYPVYDAPFDKVFDVIIAADVIYHPEHAQWIRNCASRLLRRPSPDREGGVFWLIIPVRSTGRHEGMGATVDAVFPSLSDCKPSDEMELAIFQKDTIGRLGGVGRADESAYLLFKIGWVS